MGFRVGVSDRTSMCTYQWVAECFVHELFVVQEHLEIIPVSKIFERFGGVFNSQFGDVGRCEDVLVYRAIQCG